MPEIRLIDANALPVQSRVIKHNSGEIRLEYVLADDVREAPSVDAVEVVRCRECWKRGNERECPMCHGEFDGCDYCTIDYTSDDGFCHMGKKKDAKDMDVPTKDEEE